MTLDVLITDWALNPLHNKQARLFLLGVARPNCAIIGTSKMVSTFFIYFFFNTVASGKIGVNYYTARMVKSVLINYPFLLSVIKDSLLRLQGST